MYYNILVWIVLSPFLLKGQSISVIVITKESGESLYNAHVLNQNSMIGNLTDASGRCLLTAKTGDSISISYVGYHDTTFAVSSGQSIFLIELEPHSMTEVVVFADKPFNQKAAEGRHDIPMELMESLPSFNGDPDIIKAMTFLPGVSEGKEGYSHLSVRGGDIDENLILLDGAPLYNVNHFGGFVSMFNSDMIRSVDLYKGYWPSKFGGRLSSVVDVQSRSGNFREHIFSGDLSPISSKAHLSGPIWKDRITYIIGGRRTFIDLLVLRHLAKAIRKDKRSGGIPLFTFYDVNGKISIRIADNQNMSISTFRGSDQFYYIANSRLEKEDNQYNILNQNIALNYIYYPSSSTTLKVHLSTSFYRHYFEDQQTELDEDSDKTIHVTKKYYNHTGNTIQNYKALLNGNTSLGSLWEFNYGIDLQFQEHDIYLDRSYIEFEQGLQIFYDSLQISTGEKSSFISSFFIDGSYSINSRLKLNTGLRLPRYYQSLISSWFFEPKILVTFDLTSAITINMSFNRQHQFTHQLGYAQREGTYREFYTSSDKRTPPSQSHQWTAGLFYHYKNKNSWLENANISIELFYKQHSRLNKFLPGTDPDQSVVNYYEYLIQDGSAQNYGIETHFQKTAGKFHGSAAYTLAYSQAKFEDLNHGKTFNADFDARHNLDILLLYKFRKGYKLSMRWIYRSGRPFTLEDTQTGRDVILGNYPVITSVNKYRYPAYHRLDLSLDREWRTRKRGIRNWFGISLYNAYNRVNPYYAYPSSDGKGLTVKGLFPLIPSFHWGFELGGNKKK